MARDPADARAERPTDPPRRPVADPDLGRVVAAWPALPADVRAAVLALIDGAAPDARSDRLCDPE